MDALAQARGALRSGQVEVKSRALGRAARIVDEGLRAALDLRDGGALAADLHALYGYLTMRLTPANLRNDEAAARRVPAPAGPAARRLARHRPAAWPAPHR